MGPDKDDGGWQKPRRTAKSSVGIVLQSMIDESGSGISTDPRLGSVQMRLRSIDKQLDSGEFPPLGEGPLADLHFTVSQLVFVKSDAKRAEPLLDELERGLKLAKELEPHRSRLQDIDRRLKSGELPPLGGTPLKKLHEQVTDLLYSKLDAKAASPLLDQLSEGLEQGRLERRKQRRTEISKACRLEAADKTTALTRDRHFPPGMKDRIEAWKTAGEAFEQGLDKNDFRGEGAKLRGELEKLEESARLACEKWKQDHQALLQETLDLKNVPKPVLARHQELSKASKAFDESFGGKDYVTAAADCKDLDGALRRFIAHNKFTALEDPVGEGIWKIEATRVYTPSGPIEIPGTSFSDVCPGQDHVNRQIVEAKLAGKLPATPVVPAVITPEGVIVLQDKHHTFVACMALGRPVKLALTANPLTKAKASWAECTWKGFEKPGKAGAGFSVPTDQSEALEGKATAEPGWESKVPWRKDIPKTDKGKVTTMVQDFKSLPGAKEVDMQAVSDQLAAACQDDEGLAAKLFEALKIGAVNVRVRKKPEKSTGGDWDAGENTIALDDDLAPLDMVDMLVWEAHNAIHQIDFAKLQHEAYGARMNPAEMGDKKAKIEAKTEIEYLEHLLARKGKSSEISKNGQKHLDGIDKKFREKGLTPYSEMDKEERAKHQHVVEQIFIETPHDASKSLPDRAALKSGELYAFEHVADTQNVKGITAFFRDKIPEKHPKRAAFLLAVRDVKDSPPTPPNKPPMAWGGLFYDIVSRAANTIFDLKVSVFSDDQKRVARHEASGQTWPDPLAKTLDELAKRVIQEEAPVEDRPATTSSPAKLSYFKKRNRLEQSSVALVRQDELTKWASVRGIPELAVTRTQDAIVKAVKAAVDFLGGNDLSASDENYAKAEELFLPAVAALEEFEKAIRDVKTQSTDETEFRQCLARIDQAAVMRVPPSGVDQWAADRRIDVKKVDTIRRLLGTALGKAYTKLRTDGEAPSPEQYKGAAAFLKSGIEKLATFEEQNPH